MVTVESCCLKRSFSLTLCEIPWHFSSILSNVKISLTLYKIPWQFPDLEKFYFSLTFPWRLWTLHLNIRKHRPWAYILGFIELPYFGSEQFRKIYLVERICICICIWIDVFVFVFESMLNKIFVFVFEKSKFLYLYLIKRIWPQPCNQVYSTRHISFSGIHTHLYT